MFAVASKLVTKVLPETAFIYEHIQCIQLYIRLSVLRKGRTVPIIACYTTDAVMHVESPYQIEPFASICWLEGTKTIPGGSEAPVMLTTKSAQTFIVKHGEFKTTLNTILAAKVVVERVPYRPFHIR